MRFGRQTTNPGGETNSERMLSDHIRGGYWFWCSILSEVFAQLQTYVRVSDDTITHVIYDYMRDMAAILYTDGITIMHAGSSTLALETGAGRIHVSEGARIASIAGPELSGYIKSMLSDRESDYKTAWKARTHQRTAAGYSKDRKALIAWLEKYMVKTDADGLFLTECISNEDHSQAVARLYDFLEGEGQADDEALETGVVMLCLIAIETAMRIDAVKAGLNPNGDFYKMIENTLAEYRNVEQTAAHTMEIYERDYAEVETGGVMMKNSYKVLLAKFLLDSNDHIYEPYEADVETLVAEALRSVDDIGRYREFVFEDFCANLDAYDLAHPKALRFYTRSLMKPLTEAIGFENMCRMFAQTEDWESLLARMMSQTRLDNERDRFVRGDFTLEHLYAEGDMTFNGVGSGEEFEHYLQHIFSRLGYDAQLTNKAGGDQGGDLILKKRGVVFAVQAKFYERPVGNKAVQEVTAAIKYYGANKGIVVTNSTFTKSAYQLAKKNNILLVDGAELCEHVKLSYSERAFSHMFPV